MKRTAILMIMLAIATVAITAQNWEVNMLHDINGWDSQFMHDYSKFISKTEPYVALGIPTMMGVIGLIKKDRQLQKDAIYIGASVAGAFALSFGLKYIVNRTRPYDAWPEMIYPRSTEADPSFPSGHTASAFALCTSLCIKYPKWYVIAPSAIYAVSVGVSRMHEGVHYPTDVMAGALIGAGCAIGSVYASKWLNKVLFGD
ncbi:MAG: phosphatase PAP2 family protein [Bacteroidaceae bacterium]|nr:phosphatase PAP2 family protein [Bacteroidaceae bacterium]